MSDPLAFLAGGGEASRMIIDRDWSGHPLGPPATWPVELKAALSLVLNSPESMILSWGPDLSFFFNETYFPLLGPRLPWAMGERFDVVWADGWEQAKPIIDAAFAGERQRFVDLPWKLDTDRGARDTWWTFSYSRVLDAQGEIAGLFIFTNETTDRVLSDAALRDSEAQFRAFAEAVPSHVWAARPDGNLYWVNQRVFTYTGESAKRLEGASSWGDVVHADDREAASGKWTRSVESGTPYETEFRIRRADGAYRWFLVRAEPVRGEDGAILRWVGTNTDIDERRRQAAELRQFAARLEEQVRERTADRNALWQLTPDLMLRCAFDGTINATNPAWGDVLGWDEHELLGTNLFDFLHPDDKARTLAGASELSQGQGHSRFDNRYRSKDGTYRWISWSTRSSEGVINAIGRDITLDIERAEALARTEEALRQSQKMEAVGQLTGGLAHDFNNLLAGISGSLELMGRRLARGETAEIERYLSGAQDAARRAAALTHRLLAFSRRQTLDPKATDVETLVAGMADLLRRTVGPEITLRTQSDGSPWPVLVDPNQLENALLNLCINARDAMPDGGTLTIGTSNETFHGAAAEERGLTPGDYVALCVTDTGTGMAPDVLARAMEPFFTTKPIGVGTGLGLSMVYGFVRQSGGEVRIESALNEGTTICLFLPRHFGEAERGETGAPSLAVPQAEAGQTVLVVDDEPLVRMLIVEVLEDLGYEALEAEDGAAALVELRRAGRIDLLVTDVGLPNGMNGRQVAEAARELRPGLKVLFVTGYAESAVLGPEHLGPGTQVVTKPFALVPIDRLVQAGADQRELGMRGVDQHVALGPGDDARHQKEDAAPLQAPALAEALAGAGRHRVPSGERGRRDHLVADPAWQGDFHEMLVGRQAPAAMHELFQKRGGEMLARVDEGAAGGVPAPGRDGGAGGVEDRIGARRVADPIARQGPVEDLSAHAALPYFSRPRMSSTSSAPISPPIARSIGRRSSSIGWARNRKSRASASLPQTSSARPQTRATRASRAPSSDDRRWRLLRRS